ncbi:ankyrin repeat-containing domain protein [Trichoderma sp. SZMC 28012]
MGVKTWLITHCLRPSRSSSSLSTRQSDIVDSADAQNDRRHLKEPVAHVAPDANASTVHQVKANETIERSEAIQSSATSPTFDKTPIRELWNVAYENLREEEGALVAEYEAKLQGSVVAGLGEALKIKSNTRERMWAILQSKMNEVNKDTTKFNIGSTEVKMRDVVQLVLNVVGAANNYISQAVSANPSASIAWAGISFLLPLCMNMSTESAVQTKGLEYISSLISQSQLREELYIKCYESRKDAQHEFQQSHREYKAALERLYRQILKFQAKSCCYYSNTSAFRYGLDAVKWNDWDQLLKDVRQRDTEFAAFEQIWRDLQHLEERLAAERLQRETISSIAAIRTEMSISREVAESAMTKQERHKLFSWLCDIDPSSIYNTARERHEAGTNEWLIRSEGFENWERSDGSLLWLHGKAGSGKSVISSSVISYLKGKYASQPSTAVAYFYFSFSDVKKQEVDGMLASLIKQICSCLPAIPQLVKQLGNYKSKGERPDTETLEAALVASTLKLSAVYLIIDGLDECPLLGKQREKLLKTLQNILSNAPKNSHVFLASRKEYDISLKLRALLSPPERIEIDLLIQQETLNNDIHHYIISTLATDDFQCWPVDVKEEVKESLIKKADSMFQYVRFQIEILQQLSSVPDIRKALLDLPIGLDATYDRILENIDTRFQRRVINSLKWLAFSRRVLAVEELAEIFIIDPDKQTAFDENDRLFSSSAITKYFSGLIVIDKGQASRKHSKDTVRLVHFSVKEYLTSDRIEGRPTSVFSFTEADAYIHIARSCLAYLMHLDTAYERNTEATIYSVRNAYSLTSYAAGYWTAHLEKVPRAQWPAKVALSAVLALADHSLSLLLIMNRQLASFQHPYFKYMLKKPHCYTAYRGFSQLTEVMIAQKQSANEYITQEDLDFGLYFAAYGGNLDIVQLFLEKGANMKAHCGKWDSAVHAAVSGGHMNVLEFFVSNGADVNFRTPLFVHIPYQNPHLLKYLLDHGMNMDMHDEQHRTALHKAITDHNYADFEVLLERGADINALSDKLGTPLQAACVGLNKDFTMGDRMLRPIKKLLDCGADPNIRGGEYATALQAVCSTERRSRTVLSTKAVRLLIEHSADVNVQGGHWGSALHAAAASEQSRENFETIRLLLDSGAEVDQKADDGETPLHVACYNGTIEAVRLLVDRGADVNAEGGRFGTPILAAAARPRDPLPFLTFLMDKGANINYRGGECGSSLQAYLDGSVDDDGSFHFILKYLADVNDKGGKYGTALIAACASSCSKSAECVRLLLDHGADVNAQSEEYGTALIAACQPRNKYMLHLYAEYTEIVQWLLESGADVNAQGGKHGTALSAACSWNYSKAAHLLLNHGATLNLQDYAAWYSATRHIATSDEFGRFSPDRQDRKGDTVILELLLNRGMDVNHEHPEYGTALHAMMTAEQAGPNWCKGINVLLEHHINPNIINERLGSALHIACLIKHEDVHAEFNLICEGCTGTNTSSSKTAYLLEHCHNIDVNAQGGTFGTAIQAAAYSGQTLSVKMLLDRKASVNARGGKYHSALNGAIISGHWNIANILLAAGAIPDCHLQEQPDEDWLQTVLEEDGRGAVERYRRFWEVELEKKRGGECASNS